jgi:pyruvate formate lyase activating enzyme
MLYSRRCFFKKIAYLLASLGFSLRPSLIEAIDFKQGLIRTKLSPYFKPVGNKTIMCSLCPKGCVVAEGHRGYCRVRENRDGLYYSLVYGNPCTVHIDPIEKKPFFHVLAGTMSFSLATVGCNFDCKFCQNWEISQAKPEEAFNYNLSPKEVVALAKKYRCASIASTYVEPTIFYEYMYDIGKLSAKEDILNICHSNGYINPQPLKALCHYLDAACIDLKAFSEKFYQEQTEGSLAPVLEALKILKEKGVHIEIVNLIIPTKNDDMKMIKEMVAWIKETLGGDIPLHFSRFYPRYKLKNLPPTPLQTLEQARQVALREGLNYVYIGNVPGHPGENTYCPNCDSLIIKRLGYQIKAFFIREGRCGYCGFPIYGLWSIKKQNKQGHQI